MPAFDQQAGRKIPIQPPIPTPDPTKSAPPARRWRDEQHLMRRLLKLDLWLKGLAAAAISGGANGIVTGFAAIGIDPSHFNLGAGLSQTISIGGISAAISAILGVALYLRQSP